MSNYNPVSIIDCRCAEDVLISTMPYSDTSMFGELQALWGNASIVLRTVARYKAGDSAQPCKERSLSV